MLYIIGADNDLYKIGISKNPDKRLKQLQTGNGNKLRIIRTFEVANESMLEKKLHNMLWQSKSILGKSEWFSLTEDTLNWLISYVNCLKCSV